MPNHLYDKYYKIIIYRYAIFVLSYNYTKELYYFIGHRYTEIFDCVLSQIDIRKKTSYTHSSSADWIAYWPTLFWLWYHRILRHKVLDELIVIQNQKGCYWKNLCNWKTQKQEIERERERKWEVRERESIENRCEYWLAGRPKSTYIDNAIQRDLIHLAVCAHHPIIRYINFISLPQQQQHRESNWKTNILKSNLSYSILFILYFFYIYK